MMAEAASDSGIPVSLRKSPFLPDFCGRASSSLSGKPGAGPMRHFIRIFGLFALMAACLPPPASADDRGDCGDSNPDLAISGCSAIIEAAKETKENIAVAYRLRGVAYGKKGDDDLAIKDFDTLISLYPKNANSYFRRALAYEQSGNTKMAAADYRKVLSLRPDDKDAIEALERLQNAR
jgi:tetratricopeptide (TPR) repeat protein